MSNSVEGMLDVVNYVSLLCSLFHYPYLLNFKQKRQSQQSKERSKPEIN